MIAPASIIDAAKNGVGATRALSHGNEPDADWRATTSRIRGPKARAIPVTRQPTPSGRRLGRGAGKVLPWIASTTSARDAAMAGGRAAIQPRTTAKTTKASISDPETYTDAAPDIDARTKPSPAPRSTPTPPPTPPMSGPVRLEIATSTARLVPRLAMTASERCCAFAATRNAEPVSKQTRAPTNASIRTTTPPSAPAVTPRSAMMGAEGLWRKTIPAASPATGMAIRAAMSPLRRASPLTSRAASRSTNRATLTGCLKEEGTQADHDWSRGRCARLVALRFDLPMRPASRRGSR